MNRFNILYYSCKHKWGFLCLLMHINSNTYNFSYEDKFYIMTAMLMLAFSEEG